MQSSISHVCSVALIVLMMMIASVVHAATVVQMDLHETLSCSSPTASSIPFGLGDKCNNVFGLFYEFDCSAPPVKMAIYNNMSTCLANGAPIAAPAPFPCLAGSANSPLPAISYSCGAVDDDKLVLMRISFAGACGQGADFATVEEPTIDSILVVNTCLKFPSFGGSTPPGGKTHYRVSLSSDKTITYSGFTNADCSSGGAVVYSGKLDGCVTLGSGAGRRLQSGGAIVFATAVPGATIQASSATNGNLGAAAAGSFVLLMVASVMF